MSQTPSRIHVSTGSVSIKPTQHTMPRMGTAGTHGVRRSEEHTSELQSQSNLVCRLLLEKKKNHQSCLSAGLVMSTPELDECSSVSALRISDRASSLPHCTTPDPYVSFCLPTNSLKSFLL